MGHRDADPMSNLLSSVGGIDASLFRKPPALKDIAKTTTTVKASPVAPPKPAVSSTARPAEVQASAQAAPVFAARVPVPSAQKPEGAQRAGSNPGSKLDPFSSSQLDVFAGLGPAPRQSRAMRSQLPGQSPGVSSASSSVSEGLDLLARSDAPAGATPPGKPVDVHMQDSLDALFGSQPAGKPQQVSQPAPAPAYGGHDLFGGLVSGAAPYAASSPAKSQPSSTLADDDFMEGFSQKSSAALPDDDFMGAFNGSSGNPAAPAADPFDVFAAPAPHTPQPQQPSVSHASDDLLGGFDGSLGMVDHMPTPAPPTQPATMRTPAPATSTEAVTSQQARQRLDEGYSGREESVWENPVQEGGEAHHAKWLTSGSKWLKSAGKKLTQAAQVGAATLQSKLEEMDHRFAQKGHGHGRSRVGSDGEELDEIPAFYYEWAAKIQELPHERQSSTLGQMTEDDRLVVQRILDQAAVNRAKPPQRGARSYDSYGQSNESPPAPRPITRQSRTLSTEHDFDEHSDTEVRRQPSDGLQQGDGDASPAHAARQPSESGRRSGLSQAAAARPAGIPSRPAGPIKSASLKAAAAEMMIDFGEEGMAAAMAAMSTVSDVDVAGEPEARKEARARRLAEMRERMQAQLAEKQARDEEEAALSAAKGDLRDQYQARMDAWLSGKKDNIRALLSTLHTVLWEGSGWVQPGLTDLVEPARVKKAYMKANLIIHPDKVKQKGGTVEQLVVADMAFDALKTAWGRFEAELKRG
ncbi:hypothetical protein WJX72_007422 [[Myrmecia] bisecta]|uniref:Uncharacterized protein n=1 Tax=[Myrmecia] bisecta TaxID=41462 RepID=A0AAW1QFJ2_9CHLO